MLVARQLPLGPVFGVDTDTKLTAANALLFATMGVLFVVRYLGSGADDLDSAELLELVAHVRVMACNHGRLSGWSEATGRLDGAQFASRALQIGLPVETSLWCDLEGQAMSRNAAIDYGCAFYNHSFRTPTNYIDLCRNRALVE